MNDDARVVLLVALEDNGKALAIARVTDREVLLNAVTAAIREKYEQADRLHDNSPILGATAREEAERLSRTLYQLLEEGGGL
jgi:hypothetical protein